jgi:hypothetical protein
MTSAYRFLPWTRRGLAAGISGPDGGGALPVRAAMHVGLDVSPGGPVDGSIQLLGPGDVTGFDRRIVLRTDPRPGSTNVESNYLAAVEFDPPDLPWLFTPASANADGRLRPWLVLVVVRDVPGVTIGVDGGGPLPVLNIAAPADARTELPDLTHSWAWAHAQVVHDSAVPLDLASDLATRPTGNLSRLLCPRRLAPDTSYLACVVPAFDVGVRSGLGGPPPGPQDGPAGPAWLPGAQTARLPVYHHWWFSTGPDGDLESLAAALTPVPAPAELGSVPVQLSAADPTLADLPPNAPGAVIRVRGALAAPPPSPAPPVVEQDPRVGQVLRARVDEARATGALGPPLYGEWYADVHAVPATGWIAEANAQAQHRIAAGLGAAVVRARQEELVQACWDQVGGLRDSNRLFNQVQLSQHVAARLTQRHLDVLPPGRAAQLTRSWHDRVTRSSDPARTSVAGATEASSLPDAMLSPAYRRMTANRRPPVRRAVRAGLTRQRTVLDFDGGDLLGLDPAGPATGGLDALPQSAGIPVPADGDSPVSLAALGLPGTAPAGRLRALQRAAGSARAFPLTLSVEMGSGVLRVSDELAAAPSGPVMAPDPDGTAASRLNSLWPVVRPLLEAAPPPTAFVSAGLAALQQRVRERAAPANAVALRTSERLTGNPEDPSAPPFTGLTPVGDGTSTSWVLARPRIVAPLSEMLDRLPGSWLLPGMDGLPVDSVTLVETNPSFVAACLLGANHELNTELLWRDYPGDRYGTPIRRFWARRVDGDDIGAIYQQRIGRTLAQLGAGAATGQLVLVLRGRLLLRYPDTVVYAVKGDLNGPHDADPAAAVLPIFSGRMSPDLTFLGFPITKADALATNTWFVLQQQPAAPRFGFDVSRAPGDPLVRWTDVAWSDVGVPPGGFLSPASPAVTALNLGTGGVGPGSVPGHRFGPTGAEVAAAMLQLPVRIALHASRLLPA